MRPSGIMRIFRNVFFAIALFGTTSTTLADVSATLISSTDSAISANRKRACSITFTGSGGSPVSGATVSVKQIRHDFGFGAAIPYNILADQKLQKLFLDHYEWAVFENDLKWPSTDPMSAGPNYSHADSLVAFCLKNDIKVRGHCLFWNQKSDWLPPWTLTLNTNDFKTAMDKRIDSALTHFKGKLDQWDIGNEIIHGTEFETRTGNKTIWNYIFDKCRKTDSTVKLGANDFNIIERYSDVDSFIRKISAIRNPATGTKGPIDIIGLEGHFGTDMTQSDYKAKLDKISTVGLPLWLTEVDFSVSKSMRADKLEELIRTAFANPRVNGFMMWTFWGGNLWRSDLTSFIADSATYAANDLGQRYETLLQKWTTTASGSASAGGVFSFTGFQGKYAATTTFLGHTQIDTFYLEPGQGTKKISIVDKITNIAAHTITRPIPTVRIGNGTVVFQGAPCSGEKLYVSLFSSAGKLLMRLPLDHKGAAAFSHVPTGCCIVCVESASNIYYTVRWLNIRQ